MAKVANPTDREPSNGLREALRFLNEKRAGYAGEGEPPYFAATNFLFIEIANREGIPLSDVHVEEPQP